MEGKIKEKMFINKAEESAITQKGVIMADVKMFLDTIICKIQNNKNKAIYDRLAFISSLHSKCNDFSIINGI